MATKRMAPAERKEQILQAAIRVAEVKGYSKINRLQVVEELGGQVTDGLVSRYFGQRAALRDAVLTAGLERGNLTIIAQALALGVRKAKALGVQIPPDTVRSWKEFLGA